MPKTKVFPESTTAANAKSGILCRSKFSISDKRRNEFGGNAAHRAKFGPEYAAVRDHARTGIAIPNQCTYISPSMVTSISSDVLRSTSIVGS